MLWSKLPKQERNFVEKLVEKLNLSSDAIKEKEISAKLKNAYTSLPASSFKEELLSHVEAHASYVTRKLKEKKRKLSYDEAGDESEKDMVDSQVNKRRKVEDVLQTDPTSVMLVAKDMKCFAEEAIQRDVSLVLKIFQSPACPYSVAVNTIQVSKRGGEEEEDSEASKRIALLSETLKSVPLVDGEMIMDMSKELVSLIDDVVSSSPSSSSCDLLQDLLLTFICLRLEDKECMRKYTLDFKDILLHMIVVYIAITCASPSLRTSQATSLAVMYCNQSYHIAIRMIIDLFKVMDVLHVDIPSLPPSSSSPLTSLIEYTFMDLPYPISNVNDIDLYLQTIIAGRIAASRVSFKGSFRSSSIHEKVSCLSIPLSLKQWVKHTIDGGSNGTYGSINKDILKKIDDCTDGKSATSILLDEKHVSISQLHDLISMIPLMNRQEEEEAEDEGDDEGDEEGVEGGAPLFFIDSKGDDRRRAHVSLITAGDENHEALSKVILEVDSNGEEEEEEEEEKEEEED